MEHARLSSTFFTTVETPIGELLLAGDGARLAEIRFEATHRTDPPPAGWQRSEAPFARAIEQLRAYFARDIRTFDVPLAPSGTPFQRSVWDALLEIPWGEAISYVELARRIGRPTASRAVGAANGRNPIPVLIPCHRVIGAGGDLTGYGGGLEIKRRLLILEGVLLA
jgi:methylated-DNA-[protein]-cysteine S-methyltransferase